MIKGSFRQIAMAQNQGHGRHPQQILRGAPQEPLDDPPVPECTHEQQIMTVVLNILHEILVRIAPANIHLTRNTLVRDLGL